MTHRALIVTLVLVVLCIMWAVVLFTGERAEHGLTPVERPVTIAEHDEVRPRQPFRMRTPTPGASDRAGATRNVHVVDRRTGYPIPGATVFLIHTAGEDRIDVIGDTNDLGNVSAPMEHLPAGAQVVVRHPQYSPGRSRVPDRGDASVQLLRGASIRGRVAYFDGTPIESAARVMAWSTGDHPRPRDSELASGGHPIYLTASTAADGQFELNGLSPTSKYFLTASGRGFVAPSRSIVQGPTEDVVIKVKALYGAVVATVSENGQAIQPTPCLFSEDGVSWTRPVAGAKNHDPASPEIGLLNLLPWSCRSHRAGAAKAFGPYSPYALGLYGDERDTSHVLTFWMTADERDLEIGPMTVSASFPGYARAVARIWLDRMFDFPEPQELVFSPIGNGDRASIELVFAGRVAGGWSPRPLSRPVLVVALTNSTLGQRYRYEVWSHRGSKQSIGSLPIGDYLLTVSPRAAPGRELYREYMTLAAGSNPVVTVDLSDFGDLEFLTHSPLSGALRVQLSAPEKRDDPALTVVFSSPPYILQCVPRGDYVAVASLREGAKRRPIGKAMVRIDPGERASIELATSGDDR